MAGSDKPILIVGGGLGGLATALALARAGHDVQVFEQTAEFGAIGYGIQLGPNVFPMFERLGVAAAVLEQADCPPAVRMLDAVDGAEVTRVPTGESFRRRFGHPYIIIHRVDLHGVLLAACRAMPNIALAPAAEVTQFEDRGEQVRVQTEDLRMFEGAALIAADGLRSRIRAQLIGDGEPRAVGFVAHRTIVPMAELTADVRREDVVLWGGPGCHIVHYPLRHGALFNIVAVFKTATYGEKGDIEAYRSELQHTYRNAHPSMKALLAMMDLERRWPIADRDPMRQWTRGRVALLGDAAHPTLQSLAQGAGMAIEDAVCLAALMDESGGDYAAAFRRYQALRLVRTARVQLESRFLWDHFYHLDAIEREVRNATWRERGEDDMFRCLAWLYDGFPVPGAGARPD